MQKEIKPEKIVVNGSDELIDLIRKIHTSKSEHIILTFVEDSDILISPINLKVLIETCDEENKSLIFQIIHNTVGIANAKSVGGIIHETPNEIPEELWESAEIDQRRRISERTAKLKKNFASKIIKDTPPEAEIKEESHVSEEPKKDIEDHTKKEEEKDAHTANPFEAKIASALKNSTEQSGHSEKIVKKGDFVMALDSDIAEIAPAPQKVLGVEDKGKDTPALNDNLMKPISLLGKSFNHMQMPKPENKTITVNQTPKKKLEIGPFIKKILASLSGKKIAVKILVPLFILLALAGWITYQFVPLAEVKIYIESKQVSVSRTFSGGPGSTFNPDNLTVAVKVEEVTKERADSGNATESAYRGTKAGGSISLVNFTVNKTITIPAGTAVTDTKTQLQYATVGDVVFTDIGRKSVTIEAANVGPEYNIDEAGRTFTLSGFPSSEVVGDNSGQILGGTKVEYKVVGQSDIDNVVNKLKNVTFEEATNELKETLSRDGWVIIESTIKNEVDGTPEVNPPKGSETDIFNVKLKTKSRAVYYKKTDLVSLADTLLMQEAVNKNLFEGVDQSSVKPLKASDPVITIERIDGENVTLTMTVTGNVKPDVDRDSIYEHLMGKNWNDGNEYLADQKYFAKDPEVSFKPTWFPKFLWHFPDNKNRLIVNVKEVEATAETTETPTTPSAPQ